MGKCRKQDSLCDLTALVGVPEPIRYKERIVGVVMYRDNTIIDVVREIDENE